MVTDASGNSVTSDAATLTVLPVIPTVDAEVTENSDNAVSSGGVYTALAAKQDKLAAGTGIIIDSTNNVISASGGGNAGSLEWTNISTGITLLPGTNVKNSISKEAYYCAALGIVRFAATGEASDNVSASHGNVLTLLFNASDNTYKPKLYTGGTVDIGLAAASAFVGSIPVPCAIHKGGNSSVSINISVSPDVGIATGERFYASGFYYTEDIPSS